MTATLVPLGDVLEEHERIDESVLRARLAQKPASPSAIDWERSLLGGILFDPTTTDAVIEADVVADDFQVRAHAVIWSAIVALHTRGEPVDTVLVVDELLRTGKLDEAGGPVAVSSLEALIPTAAHVPAYARVVRDHAQKRRTAAICWRTLALLERGGSTHDVVMAELSSDLSKLDAGAGNVADNLAVVRELKQTLPALGGKRRVVPTGFVDLDNLLSGGLTPGHLVVVAGRPSAGKTYLALALAEHAAKDGKHVLFFSLEMGADELLTRVAAGRARANPMRSNLGDRSKRALLDALADVAECDVVIDESSTLTIERMASRARTQARRSHLALVVVDYLQLMTLPNVDNRAEALGDVSRGLKQLARELRVPIVALSQLNRGVEARADKRPLISDLRGSGAVEQDADVIALLYREEYYLGDKTPEHMRHVAEINIGKNRNGPTGTVQLHFGRADRDPEDAPPRFANLGHDRTEDR